MKLCRAACQRMYANLSAVRAIEPAAYAAVTVRLPATALILFALVILLCAKHTNTVPSQR